MASSSCKILLHALAALLLLLLIAVPDCSAAPAPRTVTESLDVGPQHLTRASYLAFMADLDFAVNGTAVTWIRHHPVLRPQTLSTTPAFWINVILNDDAGQRLITLAMRCDNLYLAGFANRVGEWYAFAGQQRTLPGSKPLSYTGDYADLFGRGVGHRGLGSVPVNRLQALSNAMLLAGFKSGGRHRDVTLKPALGFFVLAFAEAERFPDIRNAVAAAMDAPAPQTIGEPLAGLAVNWARISCALRSWDLKGQTQQAWDENKEAGELKSEVPGVNTPEDALTKVQPLLRGKRCTWTI